MRALIQEHRTLLKESSFRKSVLMGLLWLLVAGFLTSLAQKYANQAPGNPVGDIILDNLPAFPRPDTLICFLIWGSLTIALSILIIGLLNPRYLPAGLKTIALLYSTRAVFICLTHLKTHPDKIAADGYGSLGKLLYGSNDLFFSGHTALPFLAALIFWEVKWARYYLLSAAVVFAIGTLCAKSHYSIDIFSVPFIGYGLISLARRLFKKDFRYLNALD